MAINLTVPIALPNGSRLVIDKVHVDEESLAMTVVIQLRTPIATNHIVSEKVIAIRNGACDRVSRNVAPGPLMRFDDFLVYEPGALTVPAGYDNAMNAWKAGANPGTRRTALETHMMAAGYIHASLAGT